MRPSVPHNEWALLVWAGPELRRRIFAPGSRAQLAAQRTTRRLRHTSPQPYGFVENGFY